MAIPRAGVLAVLGLAAAFEALGTEAAKKPAKPEPGAITPGAIVILDTPAERSWSRERISLDLKDADIRDVLKTFAKLGKFNLAIDPEVKGSVTVRLESVPWDQALDLILRMNGLGYVLEGNVARVGSPHRLADERPIERRLLRR